MKTKNFSKRLMLNKKTVAHLNKGELKNIHGGVSTVSNPETRTIGVCCLQSLITAPCQGKKSVFPAWPLNDFFLTSCQLIFQLLFKFFRNPIRHPVSILSPLLFRHSALKHFVFGDAVIKVGIGGLIKMGEFGNIPGVVFGFGQMFRCREFQQSGGGGGFSLLLSLEPMRNCPAGIQTITIPSW